jgi:hypothetical protein
MRLFPMSSLDINKRKLKILFCDKTSKIDQIQLKIEFIYWVWCEWEEENNTKSKDEDDFIRRCDLN